VLILLSRIVGGGGNFDVTFELLETTLPLTIPLANVGGGGNPLVLVVLLLDTVGGFIVLLLFESIGGGGNVDFLLSPVADELSPPPSILILHYFDNHSNSVILELYIHIVPRYCG